MTSEVPDTIICESHLIGRYTSGEIELCGNAEALKALAVCLSYCNSSETMPLNIPDDLLPESHTHFLANLQIQLKGEKVLIGVEDDNLNIEGNKMCLNKIAQQVLDIVSYPSTSHSSVQQHIHIEYYQEHLYLDSRSIPLIIVFESSDPLIG